MKEGEDKLSLLYYDVAITFYPDYFVSYFDFQPFHYLNWNRNLSIRSYLTYLNDSLRHWCNPKRILNTISLKVWNEKKEKNITESYPLEPHRWKGIGEARPCWSPLTNTSFASSRFPEAPQTRKPRHLLCYSRRSGVWAHLLSLRLMLHHSRLESKEVENMKKATIIVELVPEANVVPTDIIKTQIEENAKIPWMSKILEVKIEKPTSLKKW